MARTGGGSTFVDEDNLTGGGSADVSVVEDRPSGIRDMDTRGQDASTERQPRLARRGNDGRFQPQDAEPEDQPATRQRYQAPQVLGDETDDEDIDDEGQDVEGQQQEQIDYQAEAARLNERLEAQTNDLRAWQGLQEAAARDPLGTITRLAQQMGIAPDQMAQALGVNVQQAEPEFDPGRYVPENDFERAVLRSYDFLQQAPRQFEAVAGNMQQIVDAQDDVYMHGLRVNEKLSALFEYLGLDDVEFDMASLASELRRTPDADPAKAVKEKYGKLLRDKLVTKKQAGVARPQDNLRNGSGSNRGRIRATDFASAVAAVNAEQGW